MNATVPNTTTEKPILVDVPEGRRLLGNISQSSLYELMARQAIKGVSLRARGNIRGRRMILRESIDAYVASLAS